MSDEASAGSNPAATNDSAPAQTAAPVAAQSEQPVADEKPAQSAREALERSFAKLEQPAGIEQPKADKSDKARNPANGQFAKKEGEAAKPAEAPTLDASQQANAAPSRFTKQAAADWALAPESVKTEVARLERELTQGLEQYREAAQAFEPLKDYHNLAKQHGVTLDAALKNYLTLDHAWATNPVQGFLDTCKKARVDPAQLINAVVNGGQLQQQPDVRDQHINALQQEIASLRQEFGGVRQTVEQQQQDYVYKTTMSEIQSFAKDHPYFEELTPAITEMVTTKFAKDLSDAYDKAVRLNPEISAKIEADKAARQPKQPGSNPKAALSITGTPQGGSNPTTKPAGSPREALQRQFASLGI